MSTVTLNAQLRPELGKIVDRVRKLQSIPAVVYGHNLPSRALTISAGVFDATWKKAGSTSLVDLVVGEEQPVQVLIHSVQRHPTTGRVIHADFYQVRMSEKLDADIALNFIGESPAVKEQGGIFLRTLDNVKVTCLPSDLVPSIDVDISALKTFDDRIHISDLTVPAGITILNKGTEVVASVTAPRSDAELASLSEKVEENIESVEVEKKTKATDEDAEVAAEETPAKPTK